MSDPAKIRGEALQSALARLPLAVILFDEGQVLRPLNRKAERLFAVESLTGDLITARPSHPLSSIVLDVLAERGDGSASRTLTLTSGQRYRVEASRRSEKGHQRWIVLLLDAIGEREVDESFLEDWSFTDKEREVARLMMLGKSTAEICAAMQIGHNTVKSHVKQILLKSHSRNRTEFLAKLLRTR